MKILENFLVVLVVFELLPLLVLIANSGNVQVSFCYIIISARMFQEQLLTPDITWKFNVLFETVLAGTDAILTNAPAENIWKSIVFMHLNIVWFYCLLIVTCDKALLQSFCKYLFNCFVSIHFIEIEEFEVITPGLIRNF